MRKFMRTRNDGEPAPSPAALANGHTHKTNGHANGGAGAAIASRREAHSTFSSRYWSGSEWSVSDAAEGEGEGEVCGAPWEDPEFPANWRSIGDRRSAIGVTWLRPHELCARPTFLGCDADDEPGSERFAQRWSARLGPLGDASLCCAAAALALTPRLLARAAPPQRPHPARRYRFAFWVWGEWVPVEVDDRLPCRARVALGARGALAGDFTLALLEKAYAKLYGSYRALRGGSAARALQDLSGGVVQALAPRRTPRAQLARALAAAAPRASLPVASAAPARARPRACAVTGLARGAGAEPLLRLRALCGAPPPSRAPPPPAGAEVLAALAPSPADFWMSLSEFCAAFSALALVHVGPEEWAREPALRGALPWRAAVARRRWRGGVSAGGAPGGRHAHANPRFLLELRRASRCVVALAQQYAAARGALLAVGFSVVALRPAPRLLGGAAPARAREAAALLALPAGRYALVPHTRRAHAERAFLLRVFTDERADVWEENEDNVVLCSVSAELEPARGPAPPARRDLFPMAEAAEAAQLDAAQLRAALARGGAGARCSLELCRALVALRDAALRGTLPARELPALRALLQRWRLAYGAAGCARAASSYRLRALLAAAGARVSNEVLEALVLRFARARRVPLDAFLQALARLHLAHERYRCLDAKLKSNPLSLEEMILMTIYS